MKKAEARPFIKTTTFLYTISLVLLFLKTFYWKFKKMHINKYKMNWQQKASQIYKKTFTFVLNFFKPPALSSHKAS